MRQRCKIVTREGREGDFAKLFRLKSRGDGGICGVSGGIYADTVGLRSMFVDFKKIVIINFSEVHKNLRKVTILQHISNEVKTPQGVDCKTINTVHSWWEITE